MQRTAINPWDWSLKFGYNQAEIVEETSRQLICAGQSAVDAEGNPQHTGDMRSQMSLALDNLEAVLAKADMGLNNVIRLGVYTTDVDEALKNFDLLGTRFGLGPMHATNDIAWRHPASSTQPAIRNRSNRRSLKQTPHLPADAGRWGVSFKILKNKDRAGSLKKCKKNDI